VKIRVTKGWRSGKIWDSRPNDPRFDCCHFNHPFIRTGNFCFTYIYNDRFKANYIAERVLLLLHVCSSNNNSQNRSLVIYYNYEYLSLVLYTLLYPAVYTYLHYLLDAVRSYSNLTCFNDKSVHSVVTPFKCFKIIMYIGPCIIVIVEE